jgi:hypothetical protein
MARLEDMLPGARAGLPAAPDIVILGALRRAAAELCRQSHVWQEQLDDQPAVAGTSIYDCGAPSGARVERIVWVKYDGFPLSCVARERELLERPAATGAPRMWAQSTSAQTFALWPTPGAGDTGALSMYVTLVPLESASSLPDDIANEYRPGLIALAKAELMAKPDMPYYNPPESIRQDAIGQDWIARAKRKQVGGAHVQLRVMPRPFA